MENQNNITRQNGEKSRDTNGHRNQNSGLETHNPQSDRRTENAEYYRNFLERILALFSNGDQAAVSRLISVIRSGASQDEILASLSESQIPSNNRDDGTTRSE